MLLKNDRISIYNGKAGISAPNVSGNDLHCLLSFLEYIGVHRFRVNRFNVSGTSEAR